MRKELDIYKYCLIEEVTIPLHMTSPSAVYPLIHVLLILRMAVTCTIHKILYRSDSGDSEHSSSEMVVTVSTPKIYRIEIQYMYFLLSYIINKASVVYNKIFSWQISAN